MKDGTITFSTELDNNDLERQYSALVRKIASLADKIDQAQAERMPIVDQAQQLGAELDAAKAKLYEMQNASVGTFSSEEIKDQQIHVNGLQAEWNSVQGRVERYDANINNATIELDRNKEKAGEVAQQISKAGGNSNLMSGAVASAEKNMRRFASRIKEVVRSALVFVVITQALAKLRDWIGTVIKASPEATAAIARLKAALLVMAQPLVNVIIPAFTRFINLLAGIITGIAKFISALFGTTFAKSKASAAALNAQTSAIIGVGKAAKEATKSLAPFDEIQQLTTSDTSGSGSGGSGSSTIAPDFSGLDTNWLRDMLGKTAGYVTTGLLLGGLALVAIGACTGRLLVVIAGLTLLGAGVGVGEETGTLQSWVDTLGLNSVQEFVTVGILLGGLAIVAIGATLGKILMVLTGLAILGTGVVLAQESGVMGSWADTLGLSKVASWVTAGLLLAGMALVVFGILSKNILMIVAGVGLLATGTYVGTQSGTFKDWWDVLGLSKVAGYVTAGLLLGGIAFVVIGIATANIPMLVFGLGMLGTGITFGITSGTFSTWTDKIKDGLVTGWNSIKSWWSNNVAPKLTLTYWKNKFDTVKQALVQKVKDAVNGGIYLFNRFISWINSKMKFSWGAIKILGKTVVSAGSVQLINIPQIPYLATGAVIPPNQQFLAMLGDQKSGNNIEAPESLIRRIVREESGNGDMTFNITAELDGEVIYRNQRKVARRFGAALA